VTAPVAAPAPASVPPEADVAGKRRKHPAAPRVPALATARTAAAPATAPVPVAAAAPETAPAAAPPARGLREVLAEAEKLLAQGEIGDACARGEEASRLAPKSAPVHKFLGKCYMRAGRTREANDSYKQYLELAPNAADAPFVKSMIK
jgi:Flp pilus assembly protein TadD